MYSNDVTSGNGWTTSTKFSVSLLFYTIILSSLIIETLSTEQCETRVLEDVPPDPVSYFLYFLLFQFVQSCVTLFSFR